MTTLYTYEMDIMGFDSKEDAIAFMSALSSHNLYVKLETQNQGQSPASNYTVVMLGELDDLIRYEVEKGCGDGSIVRETATTFGL